MNDSYSIERLAVLRYQFEQQMLHVRTSRSECKCAVRSGRRDVYRTDKSCDLCGPLLANFHRARTQLDQKIEKALLAQGFDPKVKIDQHINERLKESRALWTKKEKAANV